MPILDRKAVSTSEAPPPLPVFSQAIVCNGMVYCSGSIGMSPETRALVEGGIADRTRQCLENLSAVLEEAGSSLQNCVKVNVFLTDMTNFAAVNKVYDGFFGEPKPCRTCVAVKELPMKTDIEVECIAHITVDPLRTIPSNTSSKSPTNIYDFLTWAFLISAVFAFLSLVLTFSPSIFEVLGRYDAL